MRFGVARYRWAGVALLGWFAAPGCATSDKTLFNVDYREPGPPVSADASPGPEAGGRSGGVGAGGSRPSAGGTSAGGAGQPVCVDADCPAVGPLTGCCAPSGICGVSFGTTCFAFPAGGASGGAPAGAGGRNGGAGGATGGRANATGGRGGTAGRGGAGGRGGSGTGGRVPADAGDAAPADAGDAATD